MNTYTTKLDMQTGTINICGGDTRFQFVIDEVPEIIESLQSEYERAKAIMGNPLLDTRGIDEAMEYYHAVTSNRSIAPSFRTMVEFYQNSLVMLRELESSLHDASDLINACSYASSEIRHDLLNGAALLNRERVKIAAILEAHKQHMPEGL